MRRHLNICLLALSAVTLVAAAPASAAKGPKPTIKSVTPMRVSVGETLTIKGARFKPTKAANTVVFRAPNGRSAFAKPRRASTTRLVVVVPAAVSRLLVSDSGKQKAVRFKLRVLAGRFSAFTPRRLSPVITKLGAGDGSGGSGTPLAVCNSDADHDDDLLTNDYELQIRTDPCLKDTDLDGIEDGYEFQSALDLNDDDIQEPNGSVPFPGKRPYPNALDSSDANTDYDGDGQTMASEHRLWLYTIANGATRTLTPLTYSEGEQYSILTRGPNGRRVPTLAAAGYAKQGSFLNWAAATGYRNVVLTDGAPWAAYAQNTYGLLDVNRSGAESAGEALYYDFDGDGYLSDDERDEDGDGLTNYDEFNGRMSSAYWAGCYKLEKSHPVLYANTGLTDPDSDGDGVLDGADDQDHDDIPNLMELSRYDASGLFDGQAQCVPLDGLPAPPLTHHPNAYGRINPFNPCLPATFSRTCQRHPSLENAGAPYDNSPNWYSLN